MKKQRVAFLGGKDNIPLKKKESGEEKQCGCCSTQPVRTVSGGSARGGLKATKAEAVNMVVVCVSQWKKKPQARYAPLYEFTWLCGSDPR